MKLHLLAIAAHPDDVELSAAGTLISHAAQGYAVGVVDLTRGELGTRGTAEQRLLEAQEAASIMGLGARENLGLRDGFFENNEANQLEVIKKIRKFQPDVVIANALYDRHPDHVRGAQLVEEAFFKSGLRLVETLDENGEKQEAWRPKKLFHMIQSTSLEPDFYVDITNAHEKKLEAIRAYKTQFFDPDSKEPQTYISKPEFMEMIISRAKEYGHRIQVPYAEGFTYRQALGVKSFYDLIG